MQLDSSLIQIKKPNLFTQKEVRFASQIINKLKSKGQLAFLVGGCIRDKMLNQSPKDFDIVTTASPKEIKKILPFPCFIVGSRFPIVLCRDRGDGTMYEITSFSEEAMQSVPKNLKDKKFLEVLKKDSLRRDFTVNALFYDLETSTVLDFVDGLKDIKKEKLQMIGKDEVRIEEDPIRILRGIRTAHKLHLKIKPSLYRSFKKHQSLINTAHSERIRAEFTKILLLPHQSSFWLHLFDLEITKSLFPSLQKIYTDPKKRVIFSQHLTSWENFELQENSSFSFFPLILAYFLTEFSENPLRNKKDLEKNKKLNEFLKEIFVFKLEKEIFFQVLRRVFSPSTPNQKYEFWNSKGSWISIFACEASGVFLDERLIQQSKKVY